MQELEMEIINIGLQIVQIMLLLYLGEIGTHVVELCGRKWRVQASLDPAGVTLTPLDN